MSDFEEVTDIVSVPKERIAVLVGKKGVVKRQIEKKCGVKISVNSESGEVAVTRKTSGDVLTAISALDLIKAIAVGFTPQKAFKLLGSNIYLDRINLTEYIGDAALRRIKARIIGREGHARSYISKLTSTEIVIGHKYVAILGEEENVAIAKNAIERLIRGASHSAVFKSLEKKAKELK